MFGTDITIEIFNRCAGTCTGCLLSVAERRDNRPVMPPHEMREVARAVASHGRAVGIHYRAVLVFGDVPSMPLALLQRYLSACTEEGLSIGITMTLVDEDRDRHYDEALSAIEDADPKAIFDITVDPVRLERDGSYARRIRAAAARAPHLHLAALLSEAVMARWSPEALADSIDHHLDGRPISLGFTPSLSNLDRRNYAYDVRSAAEYAARFYRHTEAGREHLAREIDRFMGAGTYADFLGQTFHIAPGGLVHAVAYTVFGDIILDGRNLAKPLGNIHETDLGEILSGRVARRLNVMNEAWMANGEFGCDTCGFREACTFSGIGLARMTYRDHEGKIGSCYGPAGMGIVA